MRLGTGMMGAAGFSSAVDGGLSVSERPATQMQGMSGAGPARIGTAGSGRQVQDASYFAGALRSRINEVSAEVARLRAETDKAAKDAVLSAQLDRRYEAAIKEVRALEGDLADYNLAMDKSRTSMVRGSKHILQSYACMSPCGL
jgi:intraflagellar transport protein 74